VAKTAIYLIVASDFQTEIADNPNVKTVMNTMQRNLLVAQNERKQFRVITILHTNSTNSPIVLGLSHTLGVHAHFSNGFAQFSGVCNLENALFLGQREQRSHIRILTGSIGF
jgi:hypothetical protein